MIIERWEVKLSKCNQNVGGYSVLSGNLKKTSNWEDEHKNI